MSGSAHAEPLASAEQVAVELEHDAPHRLAAAEHLPHQVGRERGIGAGGAAPGGRQLRCRGLERDHIAGLRLAALQVDGAGGFAATEREMRAELLRQRLHRLVLPAGGDPQACIVLAAGFLQQLLEQRAAHALAAHAAFDAERDFGHRIRRALGRVQFGRAPHHTVLDVGDHDRAVLETARGVGFQKFLADAAVETVAAAGRLQAQQMVAQQVLFTGLQRPDEACPRRRSECRNIAHNKSPHGCP